MKTPVIAAAIGAAIGFVVGCQTYDFEPVQPLAIAQTTQSYQTIGRTLKPNIALLVDKSGSMQLPIDANDAACDVGRGFPSPCGKTGEPLCPAGCATRWGDLRTAMSGFLTNSGTTARFGMAFFPSLAGQCNPTDAITVQVSQSNDVPSELQATADQIRSIINSTQPGGGTPTSVSVNFVANNATFSDSQRDNFILLLTDGLPNCNPNNPNDYNVNQANCRCTESNPLTCANPTFSKQVCLDKDATVAAISAIQASRNIRTIVVGFGGDTAGGAGPEVLQAMALAGGFPRTCTGGTSAECGLGATCDPSTKTCNPAFYQAADATDLARVLDNIAKRVSQTPCDYLLVAAPSNTEFISVLVNGQVVPRGDNTWRYLPPGGDAGPYGEVQLIGDLCTQARAATPEAPVDVEIRLLKTF